MPNVDGLFKGRHFEREIIILCVRWYLRYKLSLRDLVEMMAERGLSISHTTIMRWVQRYVPEFGKRWDVRQDLRRMDVPLSGGRSKWPERRLPVEQEPRRCSGQ